MNIEIKKLTPQDEAKIEEVRQAIFKKLRDVPVDGIEVEYLGKSFRVLPGVFWPHEDSKEIVKNMVINEGDEVLDLFSGSGVIAIFAALKGAKKVIATDINPTAVKNIEINAKKFNIENIIYPRLSDVFSGITHGEKFDVITGNPPFSDRKISNQEEKFIEQTIKDEGLTAHKKLFSQLSQFLKPTGRVYLSQANFGGINEMLALADSAGFSCKIIGENHIENDPRIYYAFELKRSNI
jgi:HemK-related putative methylase